ncbi:hypothetical protein [Burkholderia sp. SIMBA_062]|uniref:hypothetical protein n=1 Tax=Burkholderia sp. SIMBA_062 TaxID=3085803 RepID=UPI00397B629E
MRSNIHSDHETIIGARIVSIALHEIAESDAAPRNGLTRSALRHQPASQRLAAARTPSIRAGYFECDPTRWRVPSQLRSTSVPSRMI